MDVDVDVVGEAELRFPPGAVFPGRMELTPDFNTGT